MSEIVQEGRIITKGETAYYLVRSMDRLKALALNPLDSSSDDFAKKQAKRQNWIAWHDTLVRHAIQQGILPDVVMTARTDLGIKAGAGIEDGE